MLLRALAGCATAAAAIVAGACLAGSAAAQISDDVVKIGVLTDESGLYADIGGAGSFVAAKMAAEDFGGKVRGKPIEIVHADHQNKPDVGSSIMNRWFDNEQVDAVTDLPVSSIGLAAQEIGRQKKRTMLIAGAATSDITGKACSPYTIHWADDTYALASSTARAVVQNGGDTWFFITVDYAFGQAMERDASTFVTASGGKVLGSVRHPLNTADFSSYLLQAQASKAKIIGLANVGGDTENAIKQASEFGILTGGQSLAGFLVFLTEVHSLGLQRAQKLFISDGFYWDQNDQARTWSKRFFQQVGRMPTKQQAAVYASITHYLKAIDATGTDEAGAVNAQMRKMPVDYFGHAGSIRPDGRVLYDLTLYQVKSPDESKYDWDYLNPIRTTPKDQAFRPESEGGCNLNRS
ncbi:MAG TPA: ABC transporter substrate-binding protein [Stellaceae bacterium]